MDIYELRIRALRKAMDGLSQKDFADRHGLDASYLSQILNGHRKLGEKAARTMESKSGLPPGTLVGADQPLPSSSAHAKETDPAGTSFVVPAVIRVIAKACIEGKLNAGDVEELRRMAIHLIRKNEASAESLTAVPSKFDGLADAVFAGAEAGENVDDMLRMIELGMKKSQPTDSAKPNEVDKKKRSN